MLGSAVAAPWRLETRNWPGPKTHLPVPIPQGPAAPPPMPSSPAAPTTGAADLTGLGYAALVLVLLALGVLVWWLWRRYRRSALEHPPVAAVGPVVVLSAAPELPVLEQGAAAAQRSLADIADPDNAIVAAWMALEEAASASGVPRGPAETPTEFTMDVLSRTAADPGATQELLHLYHRARFSAAGVSRADVDTASSCLAVLAAGWRALDADTVAAGVGAVERRATDPGEH